MYDKLVTKFNTINTSAFVLETQCNTEQPSLENKSVETYPTPGDLSKQKQKNYNAKIIEI